MFNLNSTIMKFAKNASWLIFGKLYRVILVTFTTIYLSRYLGPEDFGLLNYSLSLAILFSFIIGLGLDSLIVNEVHKNEKKSGEILSSAIALRLIGWGVFVGVISGVCFFLRPGDVEFFKLMIVLSIGYLFKTFEVFRFFFESKALGRLISLAEIAAISLSCFMKFYFIYLGLSVECFFYIAVLDIVFLSIFLSLLYANHRRDLDSGFYALTPTIKKMKKLISFSWPLIFASGLYLIYSKIDQVMLGELSGMHAVGVYAAAVKLSEGSGFIFTTLAVALFPLMLAEKNINDERFLLQTKKLLSLLVVLSVSLAFVVSYNSTFISNLIFGEQYKGVDTVLMLHVWGGVFIAINAISSRYLVAEGLQKHSIYKNVIGIFFNVGLNFLLIPKYGANGAAFATVASHILSTYIYFGLRKETKHLFYIQSHAIFFTWLPVLLKKIIKNRA